MADPERTPQTICGSHGLQLCIPLWDPYILAHCWVSGRLLTPQPGWVPQLILWSRWLCSPVIIRHPVFSAQRQWLSPQAVGPGLNHGAGATPCASLDTSVTLSLHFILRMRLISLHCMESWKIKSNWGDKGNIVAQKVEIKGRICRGQRQGDAHFIQ